MFNKVKLVMQSNNNECGLCCISMIASWYKFRKPISFYRRLHDVGRDGLSVKAMIEVMKEIKLDAKAYKVENISKLENGNFLPKILYFEGHYVVLIKKNRKRAIIYDPAVGKVKLSIKELQEKFSGILIIAVKGENFKRSNEDIGEFRYILNIVKKIRFRLTTILFFTAIIYLITIYIPKYIEYIIDKISRDNQVYALPIIFELGAVIIIFFIASLYINLKTINLQQHVFKIIKNDAIDKLLKVPFSYFDSRTPGNIIYKLGLQTQIQNLISVYLPNLIINFSSIFVIILYFIFFEFQLVPILFLLTVVVGLYVSLSNRIILANQKRYLNDMSSITNIETEVVNNIYSIKCMFLDDFYDNQFKEKVSKSLNTYFHSQFHQSLFILVITMISRFLPIIVLIFLTLEFVKSNSSVGELIAIYTFVTMYTNYCIQFFSSFSQMYLIKSSLFYVNDLVDEPLLVENRTVKVDDFESLEIKNVSFAYNETQGEVLRNINLKIDKKDKVIIVGLSGCGKSTLIKLFANLYSNYEGEILLNERDYRKVDKELIKKMISIVPQIPLILSRTLKDNITMGDNSFTTEEINEALRIAEFEDEVKKMPMGLYTVLSNNGNLSGGQIQRIMIARSILQKPQVIILDEATSALDTITEKKIYENFRKINITSIIVTHRLSIINKSDKVVVMKDGEMIGIDNHENLLNNKDFIGERN